MKKNLIKIYFIYFTITLVLELIFLFAYEIEYPYLTGIVLFIVLVIIPVIGVLNHLQMQKQVGEIIEDHLEEKE